MEKYVIVILVLLHIVAIMLLLLSYRGQFRRRSINLFLWEIGAEKFSANDILEATGQDNPVINRVQRLSALRAQHFNELGRNLLEELFSAEMISKSDFIQANWRMISHQENTNPDADVPYYEIGYESYGFTGEDKKKDPELVVRYQQYLDEVILFIEKLEAFLKALPRPKKAK